MKKLSLDKRTAKRVAANIFYPLLAMAIMLAVWAIIAAIKGNPFVLPMPDKVLARFFRLGGESYFWRAVGSSILRTLICFVISFALALLLAALGALFKPLHKVLSPIVTILRAAPTVAVIFILYAFCERDELTVVVGFLIAFPIMYSAFYTAVESVDKELLQMADIYKVRGVDKLRFIYLPHIAPNLFDNSRSTLSLTLKVVVAAEILTSLPGSLGGRFQVAYASFDVSYLLAWTLVAIVFSFVLEWAVAILKKMWEVTR